MKKKILFKNKWINVIELDDWYICTDEVRTKNNDFVCVLPFYKVTPSRKEYLLRMEHNPAHESTGMTLSAITGQCETGVIKYHAQQELKEEGGYTVPISRLIYLGECSPFKSSMAKMHLFTVQIHKTDVAHDASGDGTRGEAGSFPIWQDKIGLIQCKDPYIHTALVRLEEWLYNKGSKKFYKECETNLQEE